MSEEEEEKKNLLIKTKGKKKKRKFIKAKTISFYFNNWKGIFKILVIEFH